MYTCFRQHSTFVSSYQLISFVASQSTTWIVAWDYIVINLYNGIDIKMLVEKIIIKW